LLAVKGCAEIIPIEYRHSRQHYGTVLANTARMLEKSANSDKSGVLPSGSRAKMRKKLSEKEKIAFLRNSARACADFV
jgi:hypothetical protein